MRVDSHWLRYGAAALKLLVVIYAVFGGVVAVCDDHCRTETLHIIADALFVGMVAIAVQLLSLVGRCRRLRSVSALVVLHHMRYAIAASYLFGITLALVRCLVK